MYNQEEISTDNNRIQQAEVLILKLPESKERSEWLRNFGQSVEAKKIQGNKKWDFHTESLINKTDES